MKRLTGIVLVVFALLTCATASAEPTLRAFGVNGSTAVFDCPWNAAHTDCNWSQFTNYWGATTVSATSVTSIAHDARGTASVSAAISAASYLPELHAYAQSTQEYGPTPGAPYGGSSRADANVWGVQGYKYIGDSAFLLTITATLDSSFSRPDVDRQGNHSGFSLSIFDTAGYSFGYSGADATYPPELCPILLAAPRAGFCNGMPTVFARDGKVLSDSGTITGTVQYLLQPGQEFYVGAFLDASVCCNATVDSSHTLNLAFNDASLLVSRAVPGVVPEPSSCWLAAVALLGLAGARRANRA